MLATSASGTPACLDGHYVCGPADDDLARHSQDPAYPDGLALTSLSFSENGFAWQLLRFDNLAKPDGPLWVVPHDDENAAFEAVIAAPAPAQGGRAIVVNSAEVSAGRGKRALGQSEAVLFQPAIQIAILGLMRRCSPPHSRPDRTG
ncbi:MAG: hypothetical protein IPP23_12450 [Sphingomonadales bacterium]|nr:hypothetical protein [Sphingomonadales bacterium]